jgi:hypothetical protein
MKSSSKRALALSSAVLVSLVFACGTNEDGLGLQGRDGGAGGGGGGGGSEGDASIGGIGVTEPDATVPGAEGGAGTPDAGSAAICQDLPCLCVAAGGAWDGTTCAITENPGALTPAVQTQLGGTAATDAAFKLVYPYDGTVFARGLLSPTLQWNGTGGTTATLVRVQGPGIDYKGYFGASSPGRAKIGQRAWDAITMAPGPRDTLRVQVTKLAGGQVSGPASQSWKIAPGNLRGAIYYETYGSALAGGFGGVAIMKIGPGASRPAPVVQGCGNVCHTASADGSTLVSATGFVTGSQVLDLKNNGAVIRQQGDQTFTYGGLTPDGKLSMSSTNYRTWIAGNSRLVDTRTGAVVGAPGWDGVVFRAAMPSFAPDATMITFNHHDRGGGRTIATMKYAAATRTFSELTTIATDPSRYLGWPAFTPDTKSVVYHSGTSATFETCSTKDDAGVTQVTNGNLFVVDLATKTSTRLHAANGYTGPGATSYLPANDPDLSFSPTILPVAVGGYFWVVFTSHRSYGNTLPSRDNDGINGKIWVAAIDINAPAGTDPSHPAFFVEGQEIGANNHRGFWVLNPCRDNGQGCATGDECCGGYCSPNANGQLACTNVKPPCSKEYERCTTAADCCTAGSQCINGRCATPVSLR